jgi:hypothetical protein
MPSSWAAGSTVTGPIPAIASRSSTNAVPTSSPLRSAANPTNPSLDSICEALKWVNSREGGSMGKL